MAEQEDVQLIPGQHKGINFCYDNNNFVYKLLKKKKNGTHKIRCIDDNCLVVGTLSAQMTSVLLNNEVHEHEPDKPFIQLLTFRQTLLKRAADEITPLRVIYEEEVERVPADTDLPLFQNIKSTLYARRSKHLPPQPKTIREACIVAASDQYWTRNNERFFRQSLNNNNDCTLIFISPGNLEVGICESQSIFVDGTFKIVPSMFYQLLTIHYQRGDEVLPVVYMLMSGKSQNQYIEAFQALKILLPAFNPLRLMTDNECALQKGISNVFPNIRVTSCWFHFCQSIWRKVQKSFLAIDYLRKPAIKKIIRMVMAIPLLKEESFDAAVLYIEAQINRLPVGMSKRKLLTFMDGYFKVYWVKANTNRRRGLSVCGYHMRTNNAVEGFNNKIQSSFGVHPSFGKFMASLVKLDKATSRKLGFLESGIRTQPSRRNRWTERDERIERLQQQLYRQTEPITLGIFLESASSDTPVYNMRNLNPALRMAAVQPLGRAAVPPLGRVAVPPLGRAGVPPLGRAAVPPLGRADVPPLRRADVPPLRRATVLRLRRAAASRLRRAAVPPLATSEASRSSSAGLAAMPSLIPLAFPPQVTESFASMSGETHSAASGMATMPSLSTADFPSPVTESFASTSGEAHSAASRMATMPSLSTADFPSPVTESFASTSGEAHSAALGMATMPSISTVDFPSPVMESFASTSGEAHSAASGMAAMVGCGLSSISLGSVSAVQLHPTVGRRKISKENWHLLNRKQRRNEFRRLNSMLNKKEKRIAGRRREDSSEILIMDAPVNILQPLHPVVNISNEAEVITISDDDDVSTATVASLQGVSTRHAVRPISEERLLTGTRVLVVTEEILAEDGQCPICIQKFELGDTIRDIISCGHRACDYCHVEWLRSSGICCICRKTV